MQQEILWKRFLLCGFVWTKRENSIKDDSSRASFLQQAAAYLPTLRLTTGNGLQKWVFSLFPPAEQLSHKPKDRKGEREPKKLTKGEKRETGVGLANKRIWSFIYAILCGAIWHERAKPVQVGQGFGLVGIKVKLLFLCNTHNQKKAKKKSCLCFFCLVVKKNHDCMWPNREI